MGLRGLPHYIGQSCRNIFKYKVKLQNTRVIIDGNNFLRAFINSLGGDFDCMLGFGCNYDTYYKALHHFIETFRRCRLEMVFVFVGTTGCQEFIFERVKRRNQEKIDRLELFIKDGYAIQQRNLPQALLAKTTLVRCLNDHRVHHLTMDYEEDDQMVALANRWGCPIITSDSDFYLYPYQNDAYVIPWWRYDKGLTVYGHAPDCYLLTQAYRTQDFAVYHGLGAEFISLFAAIQLQCDENENFMEDVPLQLDDRDEELGELLRRIRELSQHNSLEELLQHADEYFFREEDDYLRESIEAKVTEYSPKGAKIEYYSCLEEGEAFVKSDIQTLGGRSLPDWFIRGFRSSAISRYFAGVLARRTTCLYTQLEDPESLSPNECATDLRAVIWGILVKYDSTETLEDAFVNEYYRESKAVIERTLKPCLKLNGTNIPSLDDIPDLSESQRLDFILKVLKSDSKILESLPENTWLFILVTRYWVKTCSPAKSFIRAMILCFIKLGFDDRPSLEGLSLSEPKLKVQPRDLNRARFNLDPFNAKIPPIKNSPNRIKSHHVYAQWKTIYSEVYRLNELMMKPVVEVGPEQCFRATFLYSWQWFLESGSDRGPQNPEHFIKCLLGSVYHAVYLPLWKAIVDD